MGALTTTVWVKAEDGVNAVAFGPDSKEIPGWALDQIGEHAFDGGEKPGSSESDGDVAYSKLKKGDLEAEIDKRNADRDEDSKIVPDAPGNKPELVAALEADDQAQADQA